MGIAFFIIGSLALVYGFAFLFDFIDYLFYKQYGTGKCQKGDK